MVRIPATLSKVALLRGPVYVERSGIAVCEMVCSVFELLVLVVLVRSGLPVLSVLVLVLVLVLMLAVLFVLAVLVLTVLVLLNCLLLAEVVCAPNGSVPAPASSSKTSLVACDITQQ